MIESFVGLTRRAQFAAYGILLTRPSQVRLLSQRQAKKLSPERQGNLR
jgi:hypothetical protein